MITARRGFTIVELLIVIVVIAVLAAISIIAYNGIQTRSKNIARLTAGNDWVKHLKLYQAQFDSLPPQITNAANGTRFCLGNGFPIGGGGVARCQNVIGTDSNSPIESDNAALMTELAKAGSLPSAKPIPAIITGPYLVKSSATDTIVTISQEGTFTSGTDCGGGFTVGYTDATNRIATCYKRL